MFAEDIAVAPTKGVNDFSGRIDYDLRVWPEAKGVTYGVVGAVAQPIECGSKNAFRLDDVSESLVERRGLDVSVELGVGERFVHVVELDSVVLFVVRVDGFDRRVAPMENRQVRQPETRTVYFPSAIVASGVFFPFAS